jgi:hypothetical protein
VGFIMGLTQQAGSRAHTLLIKLARCRQKLTDEGHFIHVSWV